MRTKVDLIFNALSPGAPPPGTPITPDIRDLPPGWTPVTPEADVLKVMGRLFAWNAPLTSDVGREIWLRLGDVASRRVSIWVSRQAQEKQP
jgi:hypothetical protein